MKIRIYDKEFIHIPSYCGYDKSKYIEWVREGDGEIEVFTEGEFGKVDISNAKIKIAWIIEPYVIHPDAYHELMSGIHAKFDYVMSSHQDLIDVANKGVFFPAGGSWIWERDWGIYPKDKNVSIVASMKNWAVGHMLRQQVIKDLGSKFDLVCGYGRKPVEPKLAIFKDYRYSVVIENCKKNYYWTDKLIDCFAAGTIPIFWGCPDIGKYFNLDGIITFDTIPELKDILSKLSEEDYNNRIEAVRDNFERAKKFMVVEDYLYETFFKQFDKENLCGTVTPIEGQ